MSVPLNDNEPLQAPPTSSTGSAQEVLQWEKDAKQSVWFNFVFLSQSQTQEKKKLQRKVMETEPGCCG